MKQLKIIENESKNLLSILSPAIAKADDVRIAVAFMSQRGLDWLNPAIISALEKNSHLEFLVGLDFNSTHPEALRKLYHYSHTKPNLSLYCYTSFKQSSVYHPKLYIMRLGKEVIGIVGSSNLTGGGLRGNLEVNMIIEGNMQDEIISDIYSIYNIIKFNKRRIVPDEEYIELYSEINHIEKMKNKMFRGDKTLISLKKRMNEKAKTLSKPTPSKADLIGWLELIYRYLPEGEFSNKDIYQYQDIFQEHYPDNKNINDKIRQQLQILRDMKLLAHLGRSRWRKI